MESVESPSRVICPSGAALLPGDCQISEKTLNVLNYELSTYITPDEAFAHLGRPGLLRILSQNDPELLGTLEESRQKLDNEPGFLIIKNTGIEKVDQPLAQLGSITLSCVFGVPTQTTPRDPVIAWPVRYKPESRNVFKTFSETNSEASFHTDSQYIESPERYFGLFCIRPDQFGDGVSQVMDGNAVLERVRDVHGEPNLDELRKPFPFRLPSVFTKEDGNEVAEVIWAPIIDERGLRYRHDTLMSALELEKINVSEAQLKAIAAFEDALCKNNIFEYSLEAGDVMFVNNHKMLHGRTAFHDEQRLLYRVRMHEQHV